MQRITLDSEISYIVTEKELKEIRANTLREVEEAMYHECFEVNHYKDGLQRWDSGNWFRYKLFENVMGKLKKGEQE